MGGLDLGLAARLQFFLTLNIGGTEKVNLIFICTSEKDDSPMALFLASNVLAQMSLKIR